MALLFSTDFAGTSGTPAGFTQATSGGTFVLSGNAGVMTPPAGGYIPTNWALNSVAAVADCDIYVDMNFSDLGETYASVVARSPANNSGYTPNGICYQVLPGATNSQIFLNGTNAAYGPPPSSVGVWTARLKVVGTSVRAKLWLKSNPEPAAWQIDIVQSTVTAAGQVMLALVNGGTPRPMTFDNLAVYDAAGVPVVAPAGGFGQAMSMGQPLPAKPVFNQGVPSGQVNNSGRFFNPVVIQDFNTPAALGQVRSVYPSMGYFNGFVDTSNKGTYDPDSVLSVHDGYLDIWMHTAVPSAFAQAGGAPNTPRPLIACVMPDNYTPITYGRYALRYKVIGTTGLGYKFVPLGWPSSDTWNDGEIDFVEFDIKPTGSRSRPANATPGTIGQGANGGMLFRPVGVEMFVPDTADDWHVAWVDWTPDGVFFFHDGRLIAEVSAIGSPSKPLRLELQAETTVDPAIPVPSATETHVLVDWVASYSMSSTPGPLTAFQTRLASMSSARTSAPQAIVFDGSSSTAGTAATTNANRYVNKLGSLIQSNFPSGLGSESGITSLNSGALAPYTQAGFHIYNNGIGGAVATNFLTDTGVSNHATVGAKLAFIMISANDERANIDPNTFQTNLQARITALKAANPGIVVLLIHSYQPYDGTWTYAHSAYGTAMQNIQLADPTNVSFVSVDDAFVAIGISPNNGKNDIYSFIDTDHIHMLDQGHAFMAETLRSRLGISGSIPVVYPDITPPSAPGTPTAVASAGATSVNWAAATDDRAVTGYTIYRSDAPTVALATLGNVLTYSDTTGTTGTSYTYTVQARDLAGNVSVKSNPSNAATAQGGTAPDTTAPTAPGKPKVEPISGGVQLTIVQGTDAVGVTQNKVYRNGTLLKTVTAATVITDLTTVAGTVYSYTVTALDAALNESPQSVAGFGMSGTRFDTFNRTDGAVGTGDDGVPYNTRLSTALPMVISSGMAKQAQPYTQDTSVASRRMSSQDVGTGAAALAFGFHVGAIAAVADASGGFAFNIPTTGVSFAYLSFRQSSSSLGISIVKVTSSGGAPSVVQAGTTVVAAGDFVSVTYSGTTVTVSINGVQVVTTTAAPTKTTSEVGPYASGAFNGGIDDWVAA